jgi:hypothetical protein
MSGITVRSHCEWAGNGLQWRRHAQVAESRRGFRERLMPALGFGSFEHLGAGIAEFG